VYQKTELKLFVFCNCRFWMWEKKYRVFLGVSEVDGMQSNTEDEVLENEVKELSPLIELLNY
jgi:hypothetical protein